VLKHLLSAAAVMTIAATPLVAQTASTSVSKASQTFMTKAGIGGLFEVETSKVAASKASRDDVKSFAQKMIEDHGRANTELQLIASRTRASIPSKLDEKHQAELGKLDAKSGAAFDKAYLDAQTRAHKDAVALFQDYSRSGDHPDLKSFAAKTLPVIQGHQTHLQQITGLAGSGSAPSAKPSTTK
jgi:putative membrane protein